MKRKKKFTKTRIKNNYKLKRKNNNNTIALKFECKIADLYINI